MALANFDLPYQQRKRSAAMTRDASLAQNAYSRFLAQQRGSRDLAELDRTKTAGLGRMGAAYGRRGLATSGIFQNAQNEYGSNWLQQKQDINDGLMQALQRLEFADQNAKNQYQQTEADVEAQKQSDILATAASLQQFKPFLGS